MESQQELTVQRMTEQFVIGCTLDEDRVGSLQGHQQRLDSSADPITSP